MGHSRQFRGEIADRASQEWVKIDRRDAGNADYRNLARKWRGNGGH
jgi:hypothetical protein